MARESQTAFATTDQLGDHATHEADITLRPKRLHDDGSSQDTAQPGARPLSADEAAVHREIVELLEGLNTTIDVAHHVLTAATDALEKQADNLQQTALQMPQLSQSRPPRRRGRAVVSAAGALVLLGGLLGGLGWLLYDDVSLLHETPLPQVPIKVVKTQPVETVPGPQHAPAMAAVVPPTTAASKPTAPAKPAATVEPTQAKAQAEQEPPAPAAAPLRGKPGEPIPLGIEAPQLGGDAQVSVMVQSVPEGAVLTAGHGVGGDTWVLTAAQAPNAALLLPRAFAADQVVLDLTFVTSDGRVPEAHSIVALVEQDPARGSLAQQSPEAGATVAPAPTQAAAEAQDAPAAAATPSPAREAQPAETSQASLSPDNDADRFVPGRAAQQTRNGASDGSEPAAEQAQEASPSAEAATNDAGAAAAADSASEPAATETASPPTPPTEKTDASPSEPASDKASDPPATTRTARVNTDVNMRAAPDNKAAVIAVAPRGSSVEVIRCRAWCEVTFKGQRGFIYKSFVGDGGTASGGGFPTGGGRTAVVRSQSSASSGWFGRIRSFFRPSS